MTPRCILPLCLLAMACGSNEGDSQNFPDAAPQPDINVALDLRESSACFPPGIQYPVSSIRLRLIDEQNASCERAEVCVEVPGIINLATSPEDIEEYLREEGAPTLLSTDIPLADRVSITVFREGLCMGEPELCGDAEIPDESGVVGITLRCDAASCLPDAPSCPDEARGGVGPEALTTVKMSSVPASDSKLVITAP